MSDELIQVTVEVDGRTMIQSWEPTGTDLTFVAHRFEGEVVHACPVGQAGTTPCCDRVPFEILSDRMTLDPRLVTCGVES